MFTHVRLENWRNFITADVALGRRVFLVGPNASGKSNFLDAFRFLRDVAEPQGGFQRAVAEQRGTVSQIRSLHARRYSNVVIDVQLKLESGEWRYRLEFTQDNQRRPIVARELVSRDGVEKLKRPNEYDDADRTLLYQTHLEQVSANKEFRPVAEFMAAVRYSHLIPQLVRDPPRSLWDRAFWVMLSQRWTGLDLDCADRRGLVGRLLPATLLELALDANAAVSRQAVQALRRVAGARRSAMLLKDAPESVVISMLDHVEHETTDTALSVLETMAGHSASTVATRVARIAAALLADPDVLDAARPRLQVLAEHVVT